MLRGFSSRYIVRSMGRNFTFTKLFSKQIITLAIKRYYLILKTATDQSLCQLCKSERRNNSGFWINVLLLSHCSAREKCPNALFASRASQRYPICIYFDKKIFLINVYGGILLHRWYPLSSSPLLPCWLCCNVNHGWSATYVWSLTRLQPR